MSKPSVKDLKAFLDKKKQKNSSKKFNPDIYPFWLIEPGQEATVRILPGEGNELWPFVDKLDHKLSINGKTQNIPCPSMYGEKCPICELAQEYYREEGDESENGKYYYRDSINLAKALVIEDPLSPDPDTGENYQGKVVTLRLGFQIMQKITEEISRLDEDEPLPWDLENGTNFIIKPIKQGKYKKYDIGSGFARRSSPIPKEYIKNLEIIDLDTLLPEVKSYDEINEILEAHISGGGTSNEDSLESKKAKTKARASEDSSETESSSKSALARLMNEDGDEDNPSPDSTSDSDQTSNEEEDDDDLQAIIAKVKNRNK